MEKYEDNDLEEISSKKKTNKSVKRNESSKNNKNIVVRRKLSKKGIIYTSVFVAVILIIFLGTYIFSPKITLKGKKNI